MWCVVAGVAAHGFIISWTVIATLDVISDLHVYAGAIHEAGHQSLYDFVTPGPAHKQFTYPPFSAVLLSPVMLVREPTLQMAWPIAMIVAGVVIGVIMAPHAAPRLSHYLPAGDWWRTPALPLTITLVLVSGTMSSSLVSGQVSLFIALLVLLDVGRLVPDRFHGIATGVAAAVKLTPLIFVPFFWLAGRRRAAVTSLVTFISCSAIGGLAYPGDTARFWLTELWRFDRVAPAGVPGNQSVNGILAQLGLTGTPEKAIWIVLCVAIVCVALLRAIWTDRRGHHLLAGAIVGAASVCVSPVSWEHHTIWLLLAGVGVVWAGSRKQLLWPLIVLVVMLTLRPLVLMPYEWLPIPVMRILNQSEAVLAIMVACVVPFHEIRRQRTRDDAARAQAAEANG